MRIYPGYLRKFNIRSRIMLFLLLGIIIFSGLLLLISKLYAQDLLEKSYYNYIEITQHEMEKGVEFLITEVNMLTLRLLQNESIRSITSDNTLSLIEKQKKFKAVLDDMGVDNQIVGDIFLMSDEGESFSYAKESEVIERPDITYIDRVQHSKKLIIWGPIKKDANNNAYILLGKRYRNLFTGEGNGCIIIYIRESFLYNIYKKITPDMGYSFLLSGDGYIISHQDKNKVGNVIFDSDFLHITNTFNHYTNKYNGKTAIFAISPFNQGLLQGLGCNWNIVSVIPQENLCFDYWDSDVNCCNSNF
jgi:two-component system, sensor histidine kinase YesM